MKNKIFKYDFLIVGGGLVGSLTALSLHKKKLKVLVIDNKGNIQSLKRNKKSFIANKIAEIVVKKLLVNESNLN